MINSKNLKDALKLRTKAKTNFVILTNNKKSTKKEILDAYKQFTKADQNLISLYEEASHERAA